MPADLILHSAVLTELASAGKSTLEGMGKEYLKKKLLNLKRLFNSDDVPQIRELTDLLNQAKLQATKQLFKRVIAEVELNEGDVAAKALSRKLKLWEKDKAKTTQRVARLPQSEDKSDELGLLFTRMSNEVAAQARETMIEAAKAEYAEALIYDLGKFDVETSHQDLIFKRLLFGWNQQGETIDWFSIMVSYAASYLHHASDETHIKARKIFEEEMLSDVKVSIHQMMISVKRLHPIFDKINAGLDKTLTKLRRVESGQKKITERVFAQPNLISEFTERAGLSAFHYKREDIPFVGRKRELSELMAFANSNEKFSWWVMSGDGGTGKNRLALEFTHQLKKRKKLSCGFLPAHELLHFGWSQWVPDRTTFIIIDYASQFGSALHDLLRTLQQKSGNYTFNVRILLMERGGSQKWWQELEERQQIGWLPHSWKNALDLDRLSEEDIWSIFYYIFQKHSKTIPNKKETIQDFLEIDEVGRPLFACLAANAIVQGSNIRGWNKSQLLDQYLLREEYILRSRKDFDESLFDKHHLLAALVTMVNGLSQDGFVLLLEKNWQWLPDMNSFDDSIFGAISFLHRDNGKIIFNAIEPDIVGEYYVSMQLKKQRRSKFNQRKILTSIIEYAWTEHPAEMREFITRFRSDFPADIAFLEDLIVTPALNVPADTLISWIHLLRDLASFQIFPQRDGEKAYNYFKRIIDFNTRDSSLLKEILESAASLSQISSMCYDTDLDIKIYQDTKKLLRENPLPDFMIYQVQTGKHLARNYQIRMRDPEQTKALSIYEEIVTISDQYKRHDLYVERAKAANYLINSGARLPLEFYRKMFQEVHLLRKQERSVDMQIEEAKAMAGLIECYLNSFNTKKSRQLYQLLQRKYKSLFQIEIAASLVTAASHLIRAYDWAERLNDENRMMKDLDKADDNKNVTYPVYETDSDGRITVMLYLDIRNAADEFPSDDILSEQQRLITYLLRGIRVDKIEIFKVMFFDLFVCSEKIFRTIARKNHPFTLAMAFEDLFHMTYKCRVHHREEAAIELYQFALPLFLPYRELLGNYFLDVQKELKLLGSSIEQVLEEISEDKKSGSL